MYVNYRVDGEPRLGWWDGKALHRQAVAGPTDHLVLTGFPSEPETGRIESGPFRFAPALLRPPKILCLLRSYRAHAEEGGHEPPPAPTCFAKLRNALTAHGEPILIPRDVEGEVHHEGELALVIGRGGRRIPPDGALAHVAAATVANDVTARTLQKSDAGRGWPWVRAKSRDTFLPLGPGLLPCGAAGDLDDLELTVRVNGEVRQHGTTSRLLWRVGEIVAHLSDLFTLEPGDLVLTGTPEGVGPIRPGDEVAVQVGGWPSLRNPVSWAD
jgi:2-keto-4-pentenoate hydratase/2-oxohepta-3-ene-1,7-dioic acid hydratase in catechol pathway